MRKVEIMENSRIRVTIPLRLHSAAGRTRILISDEKPEASSIAMQIARAFRWQQYIDEGRFANATELANAVNRTPGLISRILRLTRLSPRIIHAAIIGELPPQVSLEALCRALPEEWAEQERALGFPLQN